MSKKRNRPTPSAEGAAATSREGAISEHHNATKAGAVSDKAAYQRASWTGEKHFDSSQYVNLILRRKGKKTTKNADLLDVGAIHGGRYAVSEAPLWLSSVRSIDLNVLEEAKDDVEEMDFLEVDPATQRFDVVSLSLVLNYQSDPRKRGEMLLRANELLRPKLKGDEDRERLCFVVLPRAVFENSRYFSYDVWKELVAVCGFEEQLEHRSLSAKLAMMCLKKIGEVDTSTTIKFNRRKVLFDEGDYNNFTIMVRHKVDQAGKSREAKDRTEAPTTTKRTSNQRKKARRAKLREEKGLVFDKETKTYTKMPPRSKNAEGNAKKRYRKK